MGNESKRSKLERFQNKRTQLQVELAQVAVKKEMFHKPNDGSMHHFFSMRNSQHNSHRGRLQDRIRSLQKQIAMYDRKIESLKKEIYV